jgi:glycosyltransferase involved in cell wall biosynthesis
MKNNGPLVSVHMVTYNHEKYISQAIEGILSQITNFEFEIVIGEDKSTDGTLLICREYKSKYPGKIKLVERNDNIGSLNNFIDLFNHCNGKYIAICEGDDYWINPLKLQNQIDYLENNNDYVLSFSKSYEYYDKDNILIETQYPEKINNLTIPLLLEYSWFIRTATILFRKDKLDFQFLLGVQYGVDYFLQLILLNQGKFHFLDEITSVYRHHPNGISNSGKKVYLERREILINNLVIFDNYSKNIYSKEIKSVIQTIRIGIFDYSIINLKFKHLSIIKFVDIIPLAIHLTKRIISKIRRSMAY